MAEKNQLLVQKEFLSFASGFYYDGFKDRFLAQTLPSELQFRQLRFAGLKHASDFKRQTCSQVYGIFEFQLKRILDVLDKKHPSAPIVVTGELTDFELTRDSIKRHSEALGVEVRLAGVSALAIEEANTIKLGGLEDFCAWIETNKSIYDSLGVDLLHPSFERNHAASFL